MKATCTSISIYIPVFLQPVLKNTHRNTFLIAKCSLSHSTVRKPGNKSEERLVGTEGTSCFWGIHIFAFLERSHSWKFYAICICSNGYSCSDNNVALAGIERHRVWH